MKSATFNTVRRFPPRFAAEYDSGTAMVRALGRNLRGDGFPTVGMFPVNVPAMAAVNRLPAAVKDLMYTVGGGAEGIPPQLLPLVRADEFSRWVANEYPTRRYPAVAMGSASGAMVHLCAALGIPWLPQTFMIPVLHPAIHPDEPAKAMQWGAQYGRRLLDANPDLQLHHMHDPNQDRLNLRLMTYFRVKRLRLGEVYERFLQERLEPGGTIVISRCRRTWPTTQVGERHIFQHGAIGGATEEEFFGGGPRVEAYLARYGSHRRRWEPPAPDGQRPEAEWGFEPALEEDIVRVAQQNGWKIRSVDFDEPEDLSFPVADLYRDWYRERGVVSNRLLVESFMVLEPTWALRTGSVPFWMKFNMQPSLEAVNRYLDEREPFDDIRLMLFSHGVECVGLPPIEDWQKLLGRARRSGDFAGVDADAFPRDFGVYGRYQLALRRIPTRYPLPAPLGLSALEDLALPVSV